MWKPLTRLLQMATPQPNVESFRIGDRDLFLAKIAVDGQRRFGGVRLAQDGFPRSATNDDLRAQVERIAHEVFARANLHDAAAEPRDIIHRRLERAIIRAQEIRVGLAHRDAGNISVMAERIFRGNCLSSAGGDQSLCASAAARA